MAICRNYLIMQKNELNWAAQHPAISSCISGLTVGLVTLTVLGSVGLPFLGVIGAISLAAIVTVGITYSLLKKDLFKFKRSKTQRDSIQDATDTVSKEIRRLKKRVKLIPDTNENHIKDLGKYASLVKDNSAYSRLLSILKIKGGNMCIMIGSPDSWIREYASRYRHCRTVENDLKKQLEELIKIGEEQVETLSQSFSCFYVVEEGIDTHQIFLDYLTDTMEYFNNPENEEFIKTFELKEKVRQQLLDIISKEHMAFSKEHMPSALPEGDANNLIKEFYCETLGGCIHDLESVSRLCPDENDIKYYEILKSKASSLNDKLCYEEEKRLILNGDNDYRSMLGLPKRIENHASTLAINKDNISEYLTNSYEFLYSLNSVNEKPELNQELSSSDEFTVYRTILLKQLAVLADPNNMRVDSQVKERIKTFVKDKFDINPDTVFDDIINQSLFMDEDASDLEKLQCISAAIRLDMAYNSKPITPKFLLTAELNSFAGNHQGLCLLFGHAGSKDYLIYEPKQSFIDNINKAMSNTDLLLKTMKSNLVFITSGTLNCYLELISKQLESLIEVINLAPNYSDYKAEALKLLQEYKKEIESQFKGSQNTSQSLTQSICCSAYSDADKQKKDQSNESYDKEDYQENESRDVEKKRKAIEEFSKEINFEVQVIESETSNQSNSSLIESCASQEQLIEKFNSIADYKITLELFIKDLDSFIKAKSPYWLNFFCRENKEINAAEALKKALQDILSGKNVDTKFLMDYNEQYMDGSSQLGKIVNTHTKSFPNDDNGLHILFSAFDESDVNNIVDSFFELNTSIEYSN